MHSYFSIEFKVLPLTLVNYNVDVFKPLRKKNQSMELLFSCSAGKIDTNSCTHRLFKFRICTSFSVINYNNVVIK